VQQKLGRQKIRNVDYPKLLDCWVRHNKYGDRSTAKTVVMVMRAQGRHDEFRLD